MPESSSLIRSTDEPIEITAEFPRQLAFLAEPHRYKVAYGGRGGTKSWNFARQLLLDGARQPLKVLCAREYQRSIKQSVYRLLVDQIKKLGLGAIYTVKNDTIVAHWDPETRTWGTEFFFEGLWQNVQNIKSYEGIDRCWVEEAANVSKSSWDVLIPTIRKEGSEIWISFNPMFEDDETYVRFIEHQPTDSVVKFINWRDNPWWNDILEQERLDHKERDPDTYDHVWEGECIQWMEGAIYSHELRSAYAEKRITSVEWDETQPVYTVWDLGHTDDTCIWWYQVIAGEIRILECYGTSGGTLDEYATQVLGRECEINLIGNEVHVKMGLNVPQLEHRTKYRYDTHWLPHDARAKTLTAKGKSTIEQLGEALGITQIRVVPDLGLEDGIQQARQTFKRCWFDKAACAEGLRALRHYRREQQTDEKSLQKRPKHDWSSHYADGFRYLGIAWREPPAGPPPRPKPTDLTTATLEDLWPIKTNTGHNRRI